MAKLKLHVYQDSDGEFRVYPSVLLMKPADDVIVVNNTGEDLFWNVPAGPFANPHSESVPKGLKSPVAQAAINTDVATNYAVLMLQSGKKAKGNSDPVIIVET